MPWCVLSDHIQSIWTHWASITLHSHCTLCTFIHIHTHTHSITFIHSHSTHIILYIPMVSIPCGLDTSQLTSLRQQSQFNLTPFHFHIHFDSNPIPFESSSHSLLSLVSLLFSLQTSLISTGYISRDLITHLGIYPQ